MDVGRPMRVPEAPSILLDAWEDLADRVAAPPFLRPGWITAWSRAFAMERLRVVTAHRDGRLVAVLPVRANRLSIRSPTNWHTPMFGVVAEEPRDIRVVMADVFARARGRISLHAIPRDAPEVGTFHASGTEARFVVQQRTSSRSPYVPVDGSWDDYERDLRGKLRRELRRRRRRLEAEGPVTVEVHEGSDGLARHLLEGFRVEAAGWKGERGTAIASNVRTVRFYTEVASWAATRGELRLCFLRHRSRPIAFHLSLESGGVHYLLKVAYDPSYRTLAPGMLLQWEMLRRAFEVGLRSYEFLGAPQPWKLEWTELVRERVLLQGFRRSLPGRLQAIAHAHVRPALRVALRRPPAAESGGGALLGRWREGR